MTATDAEQDDLLNVDELAAATGLTVRTTRYYAGLGLLPPPVRRGRMAYYGPEHRARLELVRALQDHGFTLAAIERYLGQVSTDASIEELALQRAMLTSWSPGTGDRLSTAQLRERAGRDLSDDDLQILRTMQAIRPDGEVWEVLPPFETSLEVMALDIPRAALVEAADAISRHMFALADELTTVLHEQVMVPFREEPRTAAEKSGMEQTMAQLRRLTLEAVMTGFQRAANQVISHSLERRSQDPE